METGFGPIRIWCFISKQIETKGAELSIIRYFSRYRVLVINWYHHSCLYGNEFNEQESEQGITSAPLT